MTITITHRTVAILAQLIRGHPVVQGPSHRMACRCHGARISEKRACICVLAYQGNDADPVFDRVGAVGRAFRANRRRWRQEQADAAQLEAEPAPAGDGEEARPCKRRKTGSGAPEPEDSEPELELDTDWPAAFTRMAEALAAERAEAERHVQRQGLNCVCM
jgi:hypothetical protein